MMNKRYGRGMVLAASARIRHIQPRTTSAHLWKVQSETFTDREYSVVLKDDGTMTCDCPDFEHRQETCKHMYAVIILETT